MATSVGIPAWQLAALQQEASAGKLSGVNPDVLAAIDQAESGGETAGAGVNSSGYGGYFGIGVGQVPASTLETDSPQSFAAQAPVAAADFAALAEQYQGNNYEAETAYQGGSSEGTGVFSALGIPASTAGPYPALTASSSQGPTSANAATSGGSSSSSPSTVSTLLNAPSNFLGSILGGAFGAAESSALEIGLTLVLVLAGLGLIVLGFTRLFPGASKVALPIAAAAAA